MHGRAQASEETVDMAVDLVDGDVGVAVLCSAEMLETLGTRAK